VTGAGAREGIGPWRRPVLAGVVANLAVGTLFGWSLVAGPAAEAMGMSDGSAALVFASAIVVLAVILLMLGPLQRRAGARRLLHAAAGLGGGGLLLAATAQHPLVLWAGIALLFGAANGLAYGVAAGLAARVPASRRGTATGLVVGAYAAGPVLLGPVAPSVLDLVGWRSALAALALIVAGLLVGAAQWAPADTPAKDRPGRRDLAPGRVVVLLWIVFAGGTAPGLMLFAHAVTVARDLQLSLRAAGLAVSALAAGNLVGRLVAGAWSDRIGRLRAVTVALTTGAVAILALAFPTGQPVVLAGYLGTGLAYGAVSALVPAATADKVGAAAFPSTYGLVFTGWGCAGLLAPLAGLRLLGLIERQPSVLFLAVTPFIAAAAAVLLLADRGPEQARS
jgi:OFA family oxalate/formate antiporter-like MFS transporter